MKVIEANLPALGKYNVRFHKESEEICDFLGESEFERLDNINHLGITSYVFTGTNHSRLEYVLLQCAIIELMPKFHKGNEALSLAGRVSIPGQKEKISSGEELLKCWALLTNSGHAQYTFGVERSLLNKANEDVNFKNILLSKVKGDLKRESKRIIEEYDDVSFHLIFALLRIERLPKGSRLKARLLRILKVLMLPTDSLGVKTSSDRYKIYRLKKLYKRIRLLSIVSLDSYYSHHPIRYEVSSALLSLDSFFSDPGIDSGFIRLLEQTSAWMADELYMHPVAAAAQKHYEIESKRKLDSRYALRLSSKEEFDKFFLNVLANGFGKPKTGKLTPLARMSFQYTKNGALFGKSLFELNSILERQISPSEKDHVSVLLNPYSSRLHIDLLYDSETADASSVGLLCSKSTDWLLRLVEAQVKRVFRRFPIRVRSQDLKERIRERDTQRFIQESLPSVKSLFDGVVKFLLPPGMSGNFSEVVENRKHGPIGFRIKLVDGNIYDTITGEIDKLLLNELGILNKDRLHEIETLKKYILRNRAKVLIVSLEKYIIRNREGVDIDDWDGVLLEIYENGAVLSIIEAKNLKHKVARETQSYNQLKDTVKLIRKNPRAIKYSRKRIKNFGAVVKFKLKED